MEHPIHVLYSGGKDSTACLEMLLAAGLGPRIVLVWVNTGALTEIQRRAVEEYNTRVYAVDIVESNQPEWVKAHGYPSDLVPSDCTDLGSKSCGGTLKISDKYDCCMANMWKPLSDYIDGNKSIETIILGDKEVDKRKVPATVFLAKDGRQIPMMHPIYFYTDAMVRAYLRAKGKWDDRYLLEHSSIDCWNCTAYWESLRERITYLKAHTPELGNELEKLSAQVVGEAKKTIKIYEVL